METKTQEEKLVEMTRKASIEGSKIHAQKFKEYSMETKSLKKQLDETCMQWGATEEVVVPVYGKVEQVPNGLLEDLETLANAHAMRLLDEFAQWLSVQPDYRDKTVVYPLEQFKAKLQEEK